ncbi:DNA ligase [Candidatus Tiddalikarchaeum anstoanum]|nr:DNA ligase [Candidatus Tiddalikarchaeum anstoanum]
MKFKELSQVFTKLSSTTKRLEMTAILEDFFKKLKCEDIGFVVQLCMGKVFPANDPKELGIANNMMIETLAITGGVSVEDVKKLWKIHGDLGETAKYVIGKKKQVTLYSNDLTLDKVKENLYKIPDMTGKGSVEKKLKIVSELLSNADPEEALYLTRIVLGSMRTGVGEGVVRDALGKAFNVTSDDIEKAYNLCTDYSYVSETLCKNPKNISNIKLKLFSPIKVMLFKKVSSVKEGFEEVGKPAIIEVKYDGMRLQIHKLGNEVRMFTRNLDEVTRQFPDAVKYIKESIKANECIIEAEMVGFNPKTDKPEPFQQLSTRIKRKYDVDKLSKDLPVKIFCFDLLMLDKKSFLDDNFEERHNKLVSIIKPNPNIMIAKGIKTDSESDAEKLFTEGIKEQEGVMFKNLKAPYQAGSRVGFGVKLKSHMTELDLVITEAYYGKGKRRDWFGSFTLSCLDPDDGKYLSIGKLGTGFSDEQFEELTKKLKPLVMKENNEKVVLTPSVVVEVEYEEIQKSPTYDSGFALRFPRLIRFRNDKKPDEIATISDVEELA